MFAIGLSQKKKGIHSFDIPKPEISTGDEVLIRILQTGIGGTDRSLLKHHLVDPPETDDFLILGHETFGVVEDLGDQVRGLKKGDVIVPMVRRGCGICPSCRHNKSDYCYTGLFKEHGIHKLHGFLTSYTVVPAKYVVKVPRGLRDVAIWAESLSIVEKAIAQMRLVQMRVPNLCDHPQHEWHDKNWGGCKRALVIGAGPIGFLATALLRLEQMEVYVLEIVPEDSLKVQLVKEMGAHFVDGNTFPPEKIVEAIGHVDIIFEASGVSDLALQFIPLMARNSVYVMTGIPRAEIKPTEVDANLLLRHIVRQNQVIIGSVNGNREHFERALIHMIRIEKTFHSILERAITHHFPLKDFEKGFYLKDPNQIKVVFQVHSK
ncbi:MAG: glucose 1-dehydrogenase [Candidatus Kerfeldbacteria bacterium]|nr:glucose 1-dehydrogenase [Candidatus Kerfeldbacteria bacterium]